MMSLALIDNLANNLFNFLISFDDHFLTRESWKSRYVLRRCLHHRRRRRLVTNRPTVAISITIQVPTHRHGIPITTIARGMTNARETLHVDRMLNSHESIPNYSFSRHFFLQLTISYRKLHVFDRHAMAFRCIIYSSKLKFYHRIKLIKTNDLFVFPSYSLLVRESCIGIKLKKELDFLTFTIIKL